MQSIKEDFLKRSIFQKSLITVTTFLIGLSFLADITKILESKDTSESKNIVEDSTEKKPEEIKKVEESIPTEDPPKLNITETKPIENKTQVRLPAIKPPSTFVCSCSKLCNTMASCEEAYYQLNTCGCNKRDGDNDGIPCEEICR